MKRLLHPAVRHEIEARYQKVCQEGRFKLFVAEIPLLFESEIMVDYDDVIVVTAEEKRCQDRFIKSTGYEIKEFEKTDGTDSLPMQEKARKADFVIHNDGSLEDLRQAVVTIYHKLVIS